MEQIQEKRTETRIKKGWLMVKQETMKEDGRRLIYYSFCQEATEAVPFRRDASSPTHPEHKRASQA